MGRHEIERVPLSRRIAIKLRGNRPQKPPRPPRTGVYKQRFVTSFGFFFAAATLLVNVVDPYSGAMARPYFYASTADATDKAQNFAYYSQAKVSFSRGGYSVVTGDAAKAIFVADAANPASGSDKAFALDLVLAHGWGHDQYSCLVALWNRESNWRVNAYNASSGAYGIPQALPGVKMAEAGADWMTNSQTQIRWGIGYIDGRYHSPCGALAHSDQFRWY
jgi:hypothetical protein